MRWNSLAELVAIQEKMNQLFEEVLYSREFLGATTVPSPGWTPSTDVWETATDIIFRVEIPGVKLADVQLELDGNRLRLAGIRRHAGPASRYVRMERTYGEFFREFEVPAGIDRNRIEANLEAGVLTITAPRRLEVSR